MSNKVIITCAVTGSGVGVLKKHPKIPSTPAEIAESAIEAAKAGAAIVHIHVREPDTGMPSNRLDLYAEVVQRLRESATDVVVNLTCGMNGTVALDSADPPRLGQETDLKSARDRCLHAIELKPEIATLDCGVMAFGESIYVGRMSDLREMAVLIQSAGVKPELECFDLGHIENAKRLISEGVLQGRPLFQFCLSTGYGAPAEPIVIQAMRDMLPADALWGGFGCGIDEMRAIPSIVNLGGHVRVGLEDNIYLRRGVFASNAELVENAVGIIERMGGSIASPAEAREMLGLVKQA